MERMRKVRNGFARMFVAVHQVYPKSLTPSRIARDIWRPIRGRLVKLKILKPPKKNNVVAIQKNQAQPFSTAIMQEDSSSEDDVKIATSYRESKLRQETIKRTLFQRIVGIGDQKRRKPQFWEEDYPVFDFQNLDLTKRIWWIDIYQKYLRLLYVLNYVYFRIGEIFYAVTWNRQTGFQNRQIFILAMQCLGSLAFQTMLLKIMQVYYNIENFFLISMCAYILPFSWSFYSLMVFLPCPTMASIVCNSTLLVLLIVLLVVRWQTTNNLFQTLTTILVMWPWIAIASMLARIFVGQPDRQFHPLKHIPFLAVGGAISQYFLIRSQKLLTLTDFIVFYCFVEPWMSSVLAPIMERTRAVIYFNLLKFLGVLSILYYFYQASVTKSRDEAQFLAEKLAENAQGSSINLDSKGSTDDGVDLSQAGTSEFTTNYYNGITYLAVSRLIYYCRSLIIKRYNMQFFEAEAVDVPKPTEQALFFSENKPHKYLFGTDTSGNAAPVPKSFSAEKIAAVVGKTTWVRPGGRDFPIPTLVRIDVAFESGLCDETYHSLGTEGTKDLYVITDWMFALPALAAAAMIHESDSLHFGFFPPILGAQGGKPKSLDPIKLSTDIRSESTLEILICVCCFLLYVVSKFMEPQIVSWSLFDRGSPVSDWAIRPVQVMAPLIIMDNLYLNATLANDQICHAFSILFIFAQFRRALYRRWRRRYLLISTQELQHLQPNVFKRLHRKTMLEFLAKTSLEEYHMFLMETALTHGCNIRDPVKDLTLRPRNPDPTATAAWKMVITLAATLARTQKRIRAEKIEKRKQDLAHMSAIIYECADRAIDFLHRLPLNEAKAMRHHAPVAQRQALGRFRKFVQWRRTTEKKRVEGASACNYNQFKAELLTPAAKEPDFVMRGRVLVCGSNIFGQSGTSLRKDDDNTRCTGQIKILYAIDGERIRQVHCSPRASFLVTNKVVFACGSNRLTELGLKKEKKEVLVPSVLKTIRSETVVQVASDGGSGQAQTLILTITGKVFACGLSSTGALTNFNDLIAKRQQSVETVIGPLDMHLNFPVKFVSCGARHSIFLTFEGKVYTAGENRRGQLGCGKPKWKKKQEVTLVEGLDDVYMISSGSEHIVAASEKLGLVAWGANSYGQCGIGTSSDLFEPYPVQFHSDQVHARASGTRFFISVACGEHHTLATSMNMMMTFAWGSNINGQCGITPTDGSEPKEIYRIANSIPLLSKKYAVISVVASGQHSLCLDRDGAVFVFGDNSFGQLGHDSMRRPRVEKPEVLSSIMQYPVRQISTSLTHTLFLL